MSEKIKIRIRVGVTADGEWSSCGASDTVRHAWTYGESPNGPIFDDLCDLGEPVAWYWVEAEVPRPVTVDETVEGTVTP